MCIEDGKIPVLLQGKGHNKKCQLFLGRDRLRSEQSFRNALKGILKDTTDLEVQHVIEWDDEGEVFGMPDQIELDLIIKNGIFIISEIKSSFNKSDVYTFYRKVQFYEKKHQRKASQLVMIFPMVDDFAQKKAEELNIKVYSYIDEIELEDHSERT